MDGKILQLFVIVWLCNCYQKSIIINRESREFHGGNKSIKKQKETTQNY